MVMPASPASARWLPALAAGLLWLFAAGSATYWGLRWWGQGSVQALPGLPVAERGVDTRQVAAGLGWRPGVAAAAPAGPVASTEGRFKLLGVVTGQRGRQGAALIAVAGQPPKPYRLGMVVGDGLVVVSLGARSAGLGPAQGQPATLTLELPALATTAPGGPAGPQPMAPVPSVLPPGPPPPGQQPG
jgi:general secretion pathway protein C